MFRLCRFQMNKIRCYIWKKNLTIWMQLHARNPRRTMAWSHEGHLHLCVWYTRTCSLLCYLGWMQSMALSVPVMVVKEPVVVADLQKKIVITKTDVNTKSKIFEKKRGNKHRTLINCYWCIICLLAFLNAFILEKTNLEEDNTKPTGSSKGRKERIIVYKISRNFKPVV